ncbi:MAG: RNA 2',3'-cyclic phosphodiesterase [Ignavibacteria bacterium]|nr:RNA 2',3'-cyclic phosphodiesterase [Ignavibacteria bacterium]
MRLFFAVNFNDSVKEKIFSITKKLKEFQEPVKYEPIEKLHLTLLFLGSVEENLIHHFDERIKKILKEFSKTNLTFNKLGVFKNFKQPRVIWIGTEENLILKNLANELKVISTQFGIITEEKEFSPHITLGRVKGKLSPKFIEYLKNFSFEPFSADVQSFELMESILAPEGSKYFIKKSFELS